MYVACGTRPRCEALRSHPGSGSWTALSWTVMAGEASEGTHASSLRAMCRPSAALSARALLLRLYAVGASPQLAGSYRSTDRCCPGLGSTCFGCVAVDHGHRSLHARSVPDVVRPSAFRRSNCWHSKSGLQTRCRAIASPPHHVTQQRILLTSCRWLARAQADPFS